MRTQRQKWYAGETISVSIGQGAVTVTPLQVTRAFAGLAVGGTWRRPHLTKEATTADKPVQWPLDPKNVKDVVSGMYGVVNEGGTGVRAAIPGIAVCGKTGTAQVASNDFVKAHAHEGQDLKDNVWFVGFAPCEKPEIVVTAFFEHGFESKYACPIVRDVMKAFFDKRQREAAVQQQKNTLASNLNVMSTLGLARNALAPSAGLRPANLPPAAPRLEPQF
jgi:penicillin-binding protein 2